MKKFYSYDNDFFTEFYSISFNKALKSGCNVFFSLIDGKIDTVLIVFDSSYIVTNIKLENDKLATLPFKDIGQYYINLFLIHIVMSDFIKTFGNKNNNTTISRNWWNKLLNEYNPNNSTIITDRYEAFKYMYCPKF